MLKKRIIPSLLFNGDSLRKGKQFDSSRVVGTVTSAVTIFNRREADELLLLDVAASEERRPPDFSSVSRYLKNCFVPVCVGGGVKTLDDIAGLLRVGADKVLLNTEVFSNPRIIDEAAKQFGSQCIVLGVDYREFKDGARRCYSHSGAKLTDWDLFDWIRETVLRGVGEIVLTSITRDGMMCGFDLSAISKIAKDTQVPLVISGGGGSINDVRNAFLQGADAVSLGSIFQFTDCTPSEIKIELSKNGHPVRH